MALVKRIITGFKTFKRSPFDHFEKKFLAKQSIKIEAV